ncbi:MAG: type II toxin-antitoxin system VapC family toxin [Candidatus Binatia bacterium]
MAVSVTGKLVLDTNVFIDYLRADLHADWIFGGLSNTIRFLSSVVLMELRLGADTPRRTRAVDRIQGAFPSGRLIAPLPPLFDHAGRLFRTLHGDGSGLTDRLGPVNDLLIALTAAQMRATVLTSNLEDFHRIAAHVAGLKIVAPEGRPS